MPFTALQVAKGAKAKSAAWEIVNRNDAMLALGTVSGLIEGSHHGHVVMLHGVASDVGRDDDTEQVGPFIMRGSPNYKIRFRTMESFPMIRVAIQTAFVDRDTGGIVNRAMAGGASRPIGFQTGESYAPYNYDVTNQTPEAVAHVRVEHSVGYIDQFFIWHRMGTGGLNFYWWIIGCDVEISPGDY
jgi:hypothetical protein